MPREKKPKADPLKPVAKVCLIYRHKRGLEVQFHDSEDTAWRAAATIVLRYVYELKKKEEQADVLRALAHGEYRRGVKLYLNYANEDMDLFNLDRSHVWGSAHFSGIKQTATKKFEKLMEEKKEEPLVDGGIVP